MCERVFSQAKLTFSLHRHRLMPMTVDALVFYKLNGDHWDVSTVAIAMSTDRQSASGEHNSI
ncbi:TPA: hypothetical protein N0F65_012854 [Lagenidium giganteum]|uniref:HAT C-terminal dimerisation domain-containing protein n=1 Tax=Lagenidium giganteum TaxID=4803 RepID=A0AAV2YNG4_9STRA|nr:TPA: hypothetical protein N0F65_012854 [Lagenidium giganteum]